MNRMIVIEWRSTLKLFDHLTGGNEIGEFQWNAHECNSQWIFRTELHRRKKNNQRNADVKDTLWRSYECEHEQRKTKQEKRLIAALYLP